MKLVVTFTPEEVMEAMANKASQIVAEMASELCYDKSAFVVTNKAIPKSSEMGIEITLNNNQK